MSLLYWGAQDWTQHSRQVSLVLSGGEGSRPQPAGNKVILPQV